MAKPWRVTFQSWLKPSKTQRRLAKHALKRGEEPQKRYRTGRFWVD